MAFDTRAAAQEAEPSEARERLVQRVLTLFEQDPQFRDTAPVEEVAAAAREPGLRIAQIMALVMQGYADRPALGQRARRLTTDPGTGRTTVELLPRYETTTYRELWRRIGNVAADWHHDHENRVAPGDFVGILGFASIDYTVLQLAAVHLGAVVVPLQTSAPATQHAPILEETQPRILACDVASLETAVAAILAGTAPQRLIVFDYAPEDDAQREQVESARAQLSSAGSTLVLETLGSVLEHGAPLPPAPLHVPADDDDPLQWLFYTSGSTGTPKGAMYTESLCRNSWLAQSPVPTITLSYMPMSHLIGYGYVIMTLANGGTSYFAARSDLSTLFEDMSMVHPTSLALVPRVCEMFYQNYLSELDRRVAAGAEPDTAADELTLQMRREVIGERILGVGCGSASLSPEVQDFIESLLGMALTIGYSSTEIASGMVMADGKILRPPVIDYKLADVPELGYFTTDKPHPRGELLIKVDRFMAGYYKRPELTAQVFDTDGFYRTGDVMAELGPDHLTFVDRRNNVIKLSQGEFVAVSRLEALYATSPWVRQIYLYGTSARSFLVAVAVPSDSLTAEHGGDAQTMKSVVIASLRRIAADNGLNGYEIPRDIVLDPEPFSLANGLLSGVGKYLRPKLKARYGERLEQLYATIAADQVTEMRALRTAGVEQPVLDTVIRAVRATLGHAAEHLRPDARFIDLGGDSLSALTFSKLLEDIFGVEVPVGVIIDPTGDLQGLARHIETRRTAEARTSFASVHGAGATTVRAGDLTLEKFIDPQILSAAGNLPAPPRAIKTVLLTGATGFLGRFLALEWLRRMAETGGTVICLARGADAEAARARIEAPFETDPELLRQWRLLAADHLRVLRGDLGEPHLGLPDDTWNELTDLVDAVVHCAAHVNHVLPYAQLFSANVAGTADLIELALTARLKHVNYISTLGVSAVTDHVVRESVDIRLDVPSCQVVDGYAVGYAISKWAGEVLLREAHELSELPVSVFRPGMILAANRFAGQLNVPDIFTRLMLSLAVTGIAPTSFYLADGRGDAPRAHYEGLPVDFLAEVFTAVGASALTGFHTYNVNSRLDDGISMDTFVDWLGDAGYPVERIDSYAEWIARFETALRSLPDRQRQASVLNVLDVYRRPMTAESADPQVSAQFESAVRQVGCDIPHLSPGVIGKYVSGLRSAQLL